MVRGLAAAANAESNTQKIVHSIFLRITILMKIYRKKERALERENMHGRVSKANVTVVFDIALHTLSCKYYVAIPSFHYIIYLNLPLKYFYPFQMHESN